MKINQFSNKIDTVMDEAELRDVPLKTVDEDGFVRDVVDVSYDPEAGCIVVRLEIQKKNGEIE